MKFVCPFCGFNGMWATDVSFHCFVCGWEQGGPDPLPTILKDARLLITIYGAGLKHFPKQWFPRGDQAPMAIVTIPVVKDQLEKVRNAVLNESDTK